VSRVSEVNLLDAGSLVVAVAFGGALTASGAGLARHLGRDASSVALAAVVVLAGAVVVAANLSALVGFRPWVSWTMVVLVGVALVVGGIVPSRRPAGSAVAARMVPLVLTTTALALGAPLLVLPVPLDTDAQGFGHLALAIRDGGTLDTLAPWRPGISYLYAPGALLVFATLSRLVPDVPMSSIMLGASHVAAFFFVWLARDLGVELGSWIARSATSPGDPATPDRYGSVMLVCAGLSLGLWTALMDAHYTAIFALLFALAYLIALLRCLRRGHRMDLAAATLALSAVVATHPDTAMIVGLGIGALLGLGWLATDRPSARRLLSATGGVLTLALALVSPWIWGILPLMRSGVESPYSVDVRHWAQLVAYHGVWPALAVLGAAIHLRRRPVWALMMVGWLAAIVELSSLGWLERLAPGAVGPLLRFDYPFSLAWHGPILPYLVLGAAALAWLLERPGVAWGDRTGWRRAGGAAAVGVALVLGALGLRAAQGLRPYGAFASANDVAAMRWLRDSTAPHARVLNYPGDYEGQRDWEAHWAPVITERDAVYFRMQPFFRARSVGGLGGVERARSEQAAMLAFWRDPADPAHAATLRHARIGYVLVPEAIGDPASLMSAWRWQPPGVLRGTRGTPRDAPYLRLVFRAGGAEVHRVVGDD
jgi:hypothetical protein